MLSRRLSRMLNPLNHRLRLQKCGLDAVRDAKELIALRIRPRNLGDDLAADTIGEDEPRGSIMRAGGERADDAFTEIRNSRCERDAVERDA